MKEISVSVCGGTDNVKMRGVFGVMKQEQKIARTINKILILGA
jgi:hypothetical protein